MHVSYPMRYNFSMLLCGSFAAVMLGSAQPVRAEEDLTATYLEWQQLRGGSGTFAEATGFLSRHPGWPDEKSIRLRAEASALAEKPDKATMQSFCSTPPISGRGMIACVDAGAGDSALVKQAWVKGDFTGEEEDAILTRYGQVLTKADHVARIDRLLYEEKPTIAKRIYRFLTPAEQNVADTRIALASDSKDAIKRLLKLSLAEQNQPGVLYARIGWRQRHGQDKQLLELFNAAPQNPPYADLWWPSRVAAAREAVTQRNAALALKILRNHGDMKPEFLSEALWLKGWITLQAKRDGPTAYKDFFRLYREVETPVSKARAAYWAARAAKQNGNPDIAQQWLEKAARYPTVFYGQLALEALGKNLDFPDSPRYSASDKKAFDAEEVVMVTRALAAGGDTKMRDYFLKHLASKAKSPQRLAMISDLAGEMNGLAAQVRIAKQGLRSNVVLIEHGWPLIDVPSGLPIEPALTLAISRQESEFDPTARSSANAQGLMQLLPATARQVADKNLMGYGSDTLLDPQKNMTLGSLYLGQIIRGFDGSYILGIASYNAGPANVRKWIAQNGSPMKNPEAAVDWLEAIPFAETRNYVQRVLENVQVFRSRLTPGTPLQLREDLVR